MATEPQLTLPLCRPASADFDQFIAGEENRIALEALRAFVTAPREPLFYLAGESGSGKTHLLTAACAAIEAEDGRAAYAPLREAASLSPALLQGLERCDLICLDDLDAIAGDTDWERAIFHLFNRAREQGRRLLISAARLPALTGIDLPDLRSRLQWGTAFRLGAPDDELKRRILKARAERSGMPLEDDLIDYLLSRHDRDTGRLIAVVARLEQLSLARGRRVTRPLLREVLAEFDDEQ